MALRKMLREEVRLEWTTEKGQELLSYYLNDFVPVYGVDRAIEVLKSEIIHQKESLVLLENVEKQYRDKIKEEKDNPDKTRLDFYKRRLNHRSNVNVFLDHKIDAMEDVLFAVEEKKFRQLVRKLEAEGVEDIGGKLYESGHVPSVTHNIAEAVSLGYGDMDQYGFWEFPAPREAYKKFENRRGM